MNKLLWLDMEMTGLDPSKDCPLEVATVITDLSLNPLQEYSAVVFQPPEVLATMDEWNQTHHSQSGLLNKVPSGLPINKVETDLINLVTFHFQDQPAILCGNSIHQDRAFIRIHFPNLDKKLHYRMLDVSAWKIVFELMYQLKFKKTKRHRAVEDIHESIAELKFYMGFISYNVERTTL